MAKQRPPVNHNDVTIMYGTTVLSGSSSDKICPELSIRSDTLQLNEKTVYCTRARRITTSLSEKAKCFLESLTKTLLVRPGPKRQRPTVLYIPVPATDLKERQIQDLNYCNFIQTMAEMFKKYAPQLLN